MRGTCLKPNLKKLTLKEAQLQYRKRNKHCRYCEFSKERKTINDCGGGIIGEERQRWCLVKDEKCIKVCEFYQLEGDK